ncbi:MAG TPA: tetratricopeptide repeat protein [Spirochaetota bacterium]|nr:tetratricopeptide repeat protein [Spirochaetota bacterium]
MPSVLVIKYGNRFFRRRALRFFTAAACILILAVTLSTEPASALDDHDAFLKEYMRQVYKEKPPVIPKEKMYSKNNVIYCTGTSNAAVLNNNAANMMEDGEYNSAKKLLDRGLRRAPLFFPFLYNRGSCSLYLKEYEHGLIFLKRAKNMLPEFSHTYLQMGYIHELMGDNDTAIEYFRKALKVNSRELLSFILIGDIYYNRRQVKTAEKYYKASLKIDPEYPNGLVGIAKIHFYRNEFYSCIIVIKSINMEEEYDKALHYYYAESSYKLRDYKTAYEQYKTLLKFKNDKFFITHARSLIQHKLNLAQRFVNK